MMMVLPIYIFIFLDLKLRLATGSQPKVAGSCTLVDAQEKGEVKTL